MSQNTGRGRGRGRGRGQITQANLAGASVSSTSSKQNKTEIEETKSEFMTSTLTSVESQPEETKQITLFDPNTQFPEKPKKRFNLGQQFSVIANHFRINLKKNFKVIQYDVSITDSRQKEVLSAKIGKAMIMEYLKQFVVYSNKILYDFKKTLISLIELTTKQFEFEVDGKKFKAIFQAVETSKSLTIEFNKPLYDVEQIRILQMLMTQSLRLNNQVLNYANSFFNLRQKPIEIGLNLDLRQGAFLSVRPSELGLTLNLNMATVALNRGDRNLIDVACEFFDTKYRQCNPKDLKLKISQNNFELLKFLKNITIRDHNKKLVKIENFYMNANDYSFKVKDKTMKCKDFFKMKYNIELRYPELPLITIGNNTHIPIEVCTTVTDRRSNLNPIEQSNMIRNANIKPNDRKQEIMNLFQGINLNADPILREFGINIDLRMTQLEASKIKGAKIEYGNKSIEPNTGRWDNKDKIFYDTKSVSKWIVIDFSGLDETSMKQYIKNFVSTAKLHSIGMANQLAILSGRNDQDYEIIMKFIEQKIQEFNVEFLLIILKNKDQKIYQIVKQIGDIKYGVITQCVDQSAIMKRDRDTGHFILNPTVGQLNSNICLKLNSKLGGTNFKLSSDDLNFKNYLKELYDSNVMIFGIDVNHPSPGPKKSTDPNAPKIFESVAAVVGSVDKNCCYYPACVLNQKNTERSALELVYHLNLAVFELITKYKKLNQKLPERLIFFRDGVSEGQFKPVRDHEMNEIRKACEKIESGYFPKISYIVVQKRHHTRLFPVKKEDQAMSGKFENQNVPPGTVVDTLIVTPDKFDFFVCSHLGIQGTSKPCHYFLLHDENNFDSNKLILFSFYLCHIYARSTTSVSYPAPTYYADLCAERGRVYNLNEMNFKKEIDGKYETSLIEIHPNLKDRMFYI